MSEPESTIVTLPSIPLPYYLESGRVTYSPGDLHPNRRNLGVYDLIVVEEGILHLGEESRQWDVEAGQHLILYPDRYHYTVRPCGGTTRFYWLHFQTGAPMATSHPPSAGSAGTGGSAPSAAGSPPAAAASGQTAAGGALASAGLPTAIPSAQPYTIRLPQYGGLPSPGQTYKRFDRLLALATERRSEAFWQEQTLFLELIQELDASRSGRNGSRALAVAELAEAYIKQNYRSPLNNTRISEELHFHHNYLTRCMKEVYGLSPMEYLMQVRLEQAKLLLIKTDWSVARVSEEVGFEYAPYFTRCFTARNGVSPLQFRKQFSV